MKKLICAAAFAALATPVWAADDFGGAGTAARNVSGHAEAYIGGVHVHAAGIGSETAFAAGAAGRVNWPVADRWNIQGDLYGDFLTQSGDSIFGLGSAVHINYREPGSYAVGGFASINGFGMSSGGMGFGDLWSWSIGPEAQIYLDNVTLYGQAWYGQLRGGSNSANQGGVRGVVRYFAHSNLRFDGEVGFHRVSLGGTAMNTLFLAAQGNYRFDGSPFSVFGRYQFDHASFSGGSGALNVHKFVVGARFNFGSDSLLDEDRNGASFDTYRSAFVFPAF